MAGVEAGSGGTVVIPAEVVGELTARIARCRRRVDGSLTRCNRENDLCSGLFLAPYDPAWVLECFPSLKLREGYRLVSYQYVESGNENGFTFVIPEGMEPPGPSQLGVHSRGGFFSAYVAGRPGITGPKGMDPDITGYLEGDGSPLSYFEASLCVREMAELGTVWHGSSWSTHYILVADPRLGEDGCGVEGSELDMLRRADWKLVGPEPGDWRPRVTLHPPGGAEVEFYTYSGLGTCQVTKHVDRYFQGYSYSSRHEVVLEGGLGYLF